VSAEKCPVLKGVCSEADTFSDGNPETTTQIIFILINLASIVKKMAFFSLVSLKFPER
jgi:hypothetical protein